MEVKKIPELDITKKSAMFLMVGLITSLLVTLVAFEWKQYGLGEVMEFGPPEDDFEALLEIPPTVQPPQTPPPVRQPQVIAVPDDEEIDEQIEIDLDVDLTDDMIIDEVIFEPEQPEEEAEKIFLFVEEDASFPGGFGEWNKFLKKNLKYPKMAKRMNIDGSVHLSFIVGKDGSIYDVQVTRSIGGGCDEEAMRVLKSSPKWKPGKQRGQPVIQRMNLRVVFKLR
ncbi:energy transducer TonB [Roseivirga misakiensis]|uniref:Energy transducer TonB n=1 Tax=Roseivirga misakiensis TaxID=1563681 RepID=A0A1E5T294_9BACT|nr:energy transducer TonB [Roseivirga misakiensis]OEK05479.1 energy transducer TonB [Roseivirga misakiensis]